MSICMYAMVCLSSLPTYSMYHCMYRIYLSIYLSVYLSIYLPICLSIGLSVCICVCICICICHCLWVYLCSFPTPRCQPHQRAEPLVWLAPIPLVSLVKPMNTRFKQSEAQSLEPMMLDLDIFSMGRWGEEELKWNKNMCKPWTMSLNMPQQKQASWWILWNNWGSQTLSWERSSPSEPFWGLGSQGNDFGLPNDSKACTSKHVETHWFYWT